MKFSKFNTFSNNRNLIFNTLNLSLAEITFSEKEAFINENLSYLNDIDFERLQKFCENGFLIDDDVDEIATLKDIYWKNRYSKDTLYISILTTKDCNFCCKYCFEERITLNLEKVEQDKIIFFLKKQMVNYKAICINWYGGEPLLNIDAIEYISRSLISYCRENGKTYSANITTNGYLLNRTMQQRLKKINVVTAQITLDGDRKIHNQRRILTCGEPTYDTILNNIKMASHIFYIDIRINVDNENIDHIKELINDIGKLSSTNIEMYMCMVTPVENNTTNPDYEKLITSKMIHLYKYATEKNVHLAKLNMFLKPSTRFCVVDSDSQFTISTNCSVYKCGESFNDKYDPGYIGYISNDGELIIDENKKMFWQKDPFNERCINCKVLPICMGGCVLKQKVKKMPDCINELKYNLSDMIDLLYDVIIGDNT